mmetsp:Transcript_115558/g.327478  ORF Transcript_115558/g.327478 Transcript_115558/m.327478 type:complete len:259 (-) Transcript_115558:328-1104(-)
MRLASFTSGMASSSWSSSRSMASIFFRFLISSVAAFVAFAASSWFRSRASSSALRFASSCSRRILSISASLSFCSLSSSALCASAFSLSSSSSRSFHDSSSDSPCLLRASIFAWYSSSRLATRSLASCSARTFASSASFAFFSSSSARFRLLSSSSSERPPVFPPASLRAIAYVTLPDEISSSALPTEGSTKTKKLLLMTMRSPCTSSTSAASVKSLPFTMVVAAAVPSLFKAHLPPEFTTTACSWCMPGPARMTSGL